MHGIVSLLDDQHTEFVEKLWVEMARRFGVGKPATNAVPHFSYHVAEAYDLDKLVDILKRLAGETAVYPIQSTGIAIFPGPESVTCIPVARNLALTQLHERVWTAVNPISQGSVRYYAPPAVPPHHVTQSRIVVAFFTRPFGWPAPAASLIRSAGGQSC